MLESANKKHQKRRGAGILPLPSLLPPVLVLFHPIRQEHLIRGVLCAVIEDPPFKNQRNQQIPDKNILQHQVP